jgi:hypothetical protein
MRNHKNAAKVLGQDMVDRLTKNMESLVLNQKKGESSNGRK